MAGASEVFFKDRKHPELSSGSRLRSGEVFTYVVSIQNLKNLKDLGGADVIRKEAWPLYRTISGVRLCWKLEEPKGPKGQKAKMLSLQSFLQKGVSLGYVGRIKT